MPTSINRLVQHLVDSLPSGAWISLDEACARVPGSRAAVRAPLRRDAAEGRLVHVQRGLWWKPVGRRRQPHPWEIAQELARRRGITDGFGPTGDAARWLLHGAALPTRFEVAVPFRARDCGPVRFVERSPRILGHLSPREVAARELQRAAVSAGDASSI